MKTVFWTLVFFLDGEAGSRPTGAVLLVIAAAIVLLIVIGGRL